MTAPILREALVHDLAIVLAGSLNETARIGPAPLLAASRIRDVLGIGDGERVKGIEERLRGALGMTAGSGGDGASGKEKP